MEISNNNGRIAVSMTNQNDQNVKKDDMWPQSQPLQQKFQDFLLNKNHSASKIQQSHQSQVQVKIEPQENTIYQISKSKESKNSQEIPCHDPKKTKKISKGHQQKDTIDNSLYSNSNRKLVTIILKFIESLPNCTNFKQNYLSPFQINGDRQNIVILPFLLLNFFLKEVLKVYYQEINQQKIIIFNSSLKQKINLLFTVLRGIFTQYRIGLQKTKEKKTKKKPNSEVNEKLAKSFIDMADYFNNKIPELFLEFVSEKFQIKRQDLNFLLKGNQLRSQQPQVKIQEQPTIKFFLPEQGNQTNERSKALNPMQMIKQCKKFIETMFPLKESEILYSYDRFFSVRLGLTHLREIFEFPHDYILDIKKILSKSKAQEHKRQSGRMKKVSLNEMQKIYGQLKSMNQPSNQNIDLLGGQFLMALMAISLTKEKHVEVLNSFLASVNRKIQYLHDINYFQLNNHLQLSNQSQLKYKKSHYNHFIYLLSKGLQDRSTQRNVQSERKKFQLSKKKTGTCFRILLTEWIYPPFFQSKNGIYKIEDQQVQSQIKDNLNFLRAIISTYQIVQRQFQGQTQYDGITLTFEEQSSDFIKVKVQEKSQQKM